MNQISNSEFLAQILLPTSNLTDEMNFFQSLGFRLDKIFPDDDPAIAVMSGHGLRLCIDKKYIHNPGVIQLLTDDKSLLGQDNLVKFAPNGTQIQFVKKSYSLKYPKTVHKFEIRQLRDKDPWVIGRAGMMYRDLVPGRLGGGIMASHIRIPKGGPVPDMVHFHTIGFQLIFCYKGWVRLVYEDQGPEFILKAGDCVTQPPEIRHRVLEASDNLEVIEIGVPAEHMTSIDHEMELPTPDFRPERKFQGQTFCRHQSEHAVWKQWQNENFEYRDTGIKEATNGVASVRVVRAKTGDSEIRKLRHNDEIFFHFVMAGKLDLEMNDHDLKSLQIGDAFVIPPGQNFDFLNCTEGMELLEVVIH